MEKLRRAYDVRFRYTLFPLHPKTPEEGRSLEDLFAGRRGDLAASRERLTRLMAQEGLPYDGERSMTYNSRLAQELAKWAETQPGGEGIHDALYRAYFVDGLNIALVNSLLGVVRRMGLPEDEGREALVSRRFREAVDLDWRRCREFGITAVPTFFVGSQAVVGAQPYEVLERLVQTGGARSLS
jgi:predicted DsbA family dithiol-disulfide isomerase